MEFSTTDQQEANPAQNNPPEPIVNSPIPNQSNFSLTIIGVVILLIVVAGGAYWLGSKKNNPTDRNTSIQPSPTLSPISETPSDSNANLEWTTFTSISRGITLNYPSSWTASDDEFISEKAFVPGKQDRSKTYNVIELQKYPNQMYVGYTNSEWFDELKNSTSPISDQGETRTKIASGTIASGENYVIFTDVPSATAQSESFKQVKAYILKDQVIYQLTLDMYDQNGLEIFKQIVPTAVLD